MQVRREERERGAFADALAHPPQRLDVAKLRRPGQAVLAGDPLAIQRGRLAHQRRRRAELRERRPVAGDLQRRREARVPGVGDVGRADQAGVVGEDDGEPGPGDHRLAGRREIQREAAVERGVDREQADVAGGVDLVDHHHPALAHRLHERRVHERDLAAGAGHRHPLVAEEELVRGRAGLHLHEAVERRAAAVLDRAAALASTGGRRSRGRSGSCPRRAGRPGAGSSSAPGRPCPAAPARARRRARRAAAAGRCACRPAGRSGRSALRARARSEGRGSGARSPSAATSSSCAKAAVIALMRGLLSIEGVAGAHAAVARSVASVARCRVRAGGPAAVGGALRGTGCRQAGGSSSRVTRCPRRRSSTSRLTM